MTASHQNILREENCVICAQIRPTMHYYCSCHFQVVHLPKT